MLLLSTQQGSLPKRYSNPISSSLLASPSMVSHIYAWSRSAEQFEAIFTYSPTNRALLKRRWGLSKVSSVSEPGEASSRIELIVILLEAIEAGRLLIDIAALPTLKEGVISMLRRFMIATMFEI